MTDADAAWEPEPAYTELHALACAMREDWDRDDLRSAMTAAHSAGWSWRDVYREVMRLAWDEDETPVTLRNSARRPGTAPPVPLDPELKAALFAELAARRLTGGQPVLTEGNDRRDAG